MWPTQAVTDGPNKLPDFCVPCLPSRQDRVYVAYTGHAPNKLAAFDADGGAPLHLPFSECSSGLKAIGYVAPGVLWAGAADGKLVAFDVGGGVLHKVGADGAAGAVLARGGGAGCGPILGGGDVHVITGEGEVAPLSLPACREGAQPRPAAGKLQGGDLIASPLLARGAASGERRACLSILPHKKGMVSGCPGEQLGPLPACLERRIPPFCSRPLSRHAAWLGACRRPICFLPPCRFIHRSPPSLTPHLTGKGGPREGPRLRPRPISLILLLLIASPIRSAGVGGPREGPRLRGACGAWWRQRRRDAGADGRR